MKENPYEPPPSGHQKLKLQQGRSTLQFYIGMLLLAVMMGLVIWNEPTILKLSPVVRVPLFIFAFLIPLVALGITITLGEKRFANISGLDAVRRASGFLLAAIALTFAGGIFFVSSCTGAMIFVSSAFPAGGRSYGPSNEAWAIALSAGLFLSNVLVYHIYNPCRKAFNRAR